MSMKINALLLGGAASLATQYLTPDQRIVFYSMLHLDEGQIDEASRAHRDTAGHWQYTFKDTPEQGAAVMMATLHAIGDRNASAQLTQHCFKDFVFEPLVPSPYKERCALIRLVNEQTMDRIQTVFQHLQAPVPSDRTGILRSLLRMHWAQPGLVMDTLAGPSLSASITAMMCQVPPESARVLYALLELGNDVIDPIFQDYEKRCAAPWLQVFSADPAQGVAVLARAFRIVHRFGTAPALTSTPIPPKYDLLCTLLEIIYKLAMSDVHVLLGHLKARGDLHTRHKHLAAIELIRIYLLDPAHTAEVICCSLLASDLKPQMDHLRQGSLPPALVPLDTKGTSTTSTDTEQCRVCLDNARCVKTSPCNHVSMCVPCYNLLIKPGGATCPECRAAVVNAERIFY